jgi:SpoVK/Ycf46/Vps4 family AAA+-type ATPase
VALGGKSKAVEDSSRPGRIDRVVEFGNLCKEGKLQIAQNILKEHADEFDITDDDKTPAQFQEVCIQKALEIKNQEFDALQDYEPDLTNFVEFKKSPANNKAVILRENKIIEAKPIILTAELKSSK